MAESKATRTTRATKAAEEPKQEGEPQAPAEEPKQEEKSQAPGEKMVRVRNKARFDYVQPSTGIKIYVHASEPTRVLDDGWIAAFVDAGLLERV